MDGVPGAPMIIVSLDAEWVCHHMTDIGTKQGEAAGQVGGGVTVEDCREQFGVVPGVGADGGGVEWVALYLNVEGEAHVSHRDRLVGGAAGLGVAAGYAVSRQNGGLLTGALVGGIGCLRLGRSRGGIDPAVGDKDVGHGGVVDLHRAAAVDVGFSAAVVGPVNLAGAAGVACGREVPVGVGQSCRIIAGIAVQVERLRVAEIGVGYGIRGGVPVGAEEAAEIALVEAGAEVVERAFGIAVLAGELVGLGALVAAAHLGAKGRVGEHGLHPHFHP